MRDGKRGRVVVTCDYNSLLQDMAAIADCNDILAMNRGKTPFPPLHLLCLPASDRAPTYDCRAQDIKWADFSLESFYAFPILAFALGCHVQVPPVFWEYRRPTVKGTP